MFETDKDLNLLVKVINREYYMSVHVQNPSHFLSEKEYTKKHQHDWSFP